MLPPIKAPILFVAAAVCREAGFCHEDLFMSDWAMPVVGGIGGTNVKVRSAKWPFGVIGNPQINFKQISTPVRYHPRII